MMLAARCLLPTLRPIYCEHPAQRTRDYERRADEADPKMPVRKDGTVRSILRLDGLAKQSSSPSILLALDYGIHVQRWKPGSIIDDGHHLDLSRLPPSPVVPSVRRVEVNSLFLVNVLDVVH